LAGKDNPLFLQAGAAWPASAARAPPGGVPRQSDDRHLTRAVPVARAPCRTNSAEQHPVGAARCL